MTTGTEAKDFFKQRRSAAEIKSEFLPQFFQIWGEVLLTKPTPVEKILYLDANAGMGRPEDEMPASFQVLKRIFASAGGRYDLNKTVQPFFYEGNKAVATTLPQDTETLPFYSDLQHKPVFVHTKETVAVLQAELEQETPAFCFLDPFGNKVTQALWESALASGTSGFLMLFDYKRLTAALHVRTGQGALQTLLGERFAALQSFFAKTSSAAKRETYALKTLTESLWQKGYQTSRFRINVPGKDQSSHYLLFVSKSDLAHTKFKELLLPYSDVQEDGVPLFGANLKPVRLLVPEYSKYLEFSLVNLMDDLLQNASLYNSMMLEKIYEKHNVGKAYSRENYQTAIEKLKEQGKITLLNPKTGQVVYKLTYACRIKFKV